MATNITTKSKNLKASKVSTPLSKVGSVNNMKTGDTNISVDKISVDRTKLKLKARVLVVFL